MSEVNSYNVQSWVPVSKVASVMLQLRKRGYIINSGSDLVRVLLDLVYDNLCNGERPLTVTEAIHHLSIMGFSMKQLQGDRRSHKRMSQATSEDDIRLSVAPQFNRDIDYVDQLLSSSKNTTYYDDDREVTKEEWEAKYKAAAREKILNTGKQTQTPVSGDGPPIIYDDTVPDLSHP
jgi:hypothetical protein